MERSDLKKKILRSLDTDADLLQVQKDLEHVSYSYDFRNDFREKILNKISMPVKAVSRHIEFIKTMSWAFNRVAITGLAAIILLIISIFLMEGSFSFSAMLGFSDNYDESIISLLTGK